jgi:hypothetical protein
MADPDRQDSEAQSDNDLAERAKFSPHLWAVTEHKIGRPIFLVAIVGQNRFRRVDLPDGIEAMSEQQQIEVIRHAAKRHFEQTSGDAGPFGKILGYWYRHASDQSWLLNTEGEVLDRNAGQVYVGKYTLSLKGKPGRDIAFLFRQHRHK